jgi:hypothetical protein
MLPLAVLESKTEPFPSSEHTKTDMLSAFGMKATSFILFLCPPNVETVFINTIYYLLSCSVENYSVSVISSSTDVLISLRVDV